MSESISPKLFDLRILVEIIIVLVIMLGIKALADHFEITGAGSIAMWAGIIAATVFMRRPSCQLARPGFDFAKGRKGMADHFRIGPSLRWYLSWFLWRCYSNRSPKHWALRNRRRRRIVLLFFLGKPALFFTYLIAVVWFGAALGEELLMRGFLFNRLADLFGKSKFAWGAALLIHAMIFGSLHAYQGMQGIIATGGCCLDLRGNLPPQ